MLNNTFFIKSVIFKNNNKNINKTYFYTIVVNSFY